MPPIVLQTTNVHDVAAAIYGVWQALDMMGSHGESLLAEFKAGMRPREDEFVAEPTEADSAQMLAAFRAYETTIVADQSLDGDGDLCGAWTSPDIQSKMQILQRRAVARKRARSQSYTQNMLALRRANAVKINTDDVGDEVEDEDDTRDQLGFLGFVFRGACMGASILFRRAGGKAALAYVGRFAKAAATKVVSLVRRPATAALGKSAAKYVAVAGAISVGESFVGNLATRVAGRATDLGKGALWLLAAYAAYQFLQKQERSY